MKNIVALIGAGACVLGVALIAIAFLFARNDLSMLNTGVEYDKLQYVCTKDVSSIEIEESSNEVFVKKGNVDKVTVDYYYNQKELEYTFEETNSTLTVKRVPKKNSFSGGINIDFDWPKLIVTVPEKEYENIDIMLSSGGVEVSDITVKSLNIQNSSGSAKVDSIKSENLYVKNTSGSISVSGIQTTSLETSNSSGSINLSDISASLVKAQNTSGGIHVENVKASSVYAQSSSGSIHFTTVSADDVNGITTSGGISLEALDAASAITLQASSGSIHGSVVGRQEDFSIFTNTGSGSSNLHDGMGGSKQLNCTTTSGSIKIDFE